MSSISTTNNSKLIHIRPSQLLSIPDSFGDEVKFFLPPLGPGSLYALESLMLLKLLKCVNPAFIFEFGTFKGDTTRMLLENLPDSDVIGERIYTLDLPGLDNVVFQGADKECAAEVLNFPRKYLGSAKKHLVKQIFHDSMTFDASSYLNKFQYIFVDANHELTYVIKDTENAFKMLSKTLPTCVIWHDYGNADFPELTKYLDDLASDEKKLYHIENTMLVFYIAGIEVPPQREFTSWSGGNRPN